MTPASSLIGVEAAGEGIETGAPRRAADRSAVAAACCTSSFSAIMQDEDGQILEAHLDLGRPGLPGQPDPSNAWLRDSGRALRRLSPTPRRSTRSARMAQLGGHHPPRAWKSAHAVAWALGPGALGGDRGHVIDLICPSGRGDKDLAEALDKLGSGERRRSVQGELGGAPARRARSPARLGDRGGADRGGVGARGPPRRADALPDGRLSGRRDAAAIGIAYAEAGADLIELGVPFSDPLADGPVIHAAATAALGAGASVHAVLEAGARIAEHVPVVLMCYANPLFARGPERFAGEPAGRGISGLIVPDLPLEESAEVLAACDAAGVALVPLVAPTTPDARLGEIGRNARGFVYTVSVTGTTGERTTSGGDAAGLIGRVKAHSLVPVALGFGILDGAQARPPPTPEVGVIVGSRLVRAVAEAVAEGADPAQGGIPLELDPRVLLTSAALSPSGLSAVGAASSAYEHRYGTHGAGSAIYGFARHGPDAEARSCAPTRDRLIGWAVGAPRSCRRSSPPVTGMSVLGTCSMRPQRGHQSGPLRRVPDRGRPAALREGDAGLIGVGLRSCSGRYLVSVSAGLNLNAGLLVSAATIGCALHRVAASTPSRHRGGVPCNQSVLGKASEGGLVAGACDSRVSACGSSEQQLEQWLRAARARSASSSVRETTVDIYSSLPLQGASSAQTIPLVNGIKLALSSRPVVRPGNFTVSLPVAR